MAVCRHQWKSKFSNKERLQSVPIRKCLLSKEERGNLRAPTSDNCVFLSLDGCVALLSVSPPRPGAVGDEQVPRGFPAGPCGVSPVPPCSDAAVVQRPVLLPGPGCTAGHRQTPATHTQRQTKPLQSRFFFSPTLNSHYSDMYICIHKRACSYKKSKTNAEPCQDYTFHFPAYK